MTPTVIGLYSSTPQSGKTAIAEYLEATYGYKRLPFAGTLKEMLIPLLTAYGYSEREARHYVYVDKQHKVPYLNVTIRHMLQTLGTEWGRHCVHMDLWTMCWERHSQRYPLIVVDDVRFVNEANLVKQLRAGQGAMWLVERDVPALGTDHPSEGALDSWEFDRHVSNGGATLDDLYNLVDSLLS